MHALAPWLHQIICAMPYPLDEILRAGMNDVGRVSAY